MKKNAFLMAGVAAATLLAGGWALAQSNGRGNGEMEAMGPGMHGRMGPGMHGHMGQETRGQMGAGMHGQRGPGMPGEMGMHGQMGGGMHGQMGRGMHGGMGMHGPMGSGMHGGPGQAQLGPGDLDSLKGELGITAAQEPAWAKYAKALQDAAAARQSARDSVDPGTIGKLSPAERYAFRSKMREQAQTQLDAVKTAAEELLATLDDAQKEKAEEALPGLAFGPDPMRGAMGGSRHRH